MTHNLIQIKILKCFLVTCGRLNQLPASKGVIKDRAFLWQRNQLSVFFRQQCQLQEANRHVFMLALHADVLRDVRAMHKIKQTPAETLVASEIDVDSSLVVLYFGSQCLYLYQTERWWRRPSTPTHQPSDPPRAQRPECQPSGQHDWPNSASNTQIHTNDISSLASESETVANTHAYTLWHFLVKRTSVHSPSHHHHHNQRFFVEG